MNEIQGEPVAQALGHFPVPVLLNDTELLRIAASPRRRLFHSLNRASAFAPLIIVCCVLPAFQLLSHLDLDEESSLWGLRSLAVANSTTMQAKLEPGLNEAGEPLIFQPPLAAWLNGIVVRALGPSNLFSMSFVSLCATGIAVWLSTRCAWRIGGAKTALIAALLMCSHPLVLDAAIVPTNSAVGMCLLLASVFGVQRHLEQGERLLSPSLLASGVTWGMALLAVGPIALTLPVIFMLHALRYNKRRTVVTDAEPRRSRTSWPVLRSTLIFVTIGLAIGGWWEIMMLSQHGFEFLHSWWVGLPKECVNHEGSHWKADLCPVLQQSWRDSFVQSAMLIGWMFVGWKYAIRKIRSTNDEPERRRYQLLLLWWLLTFAGRMLAEMTGSMVHTNTSVWNVALLTPSILLASLGFAALIDRAISRRGEFVLMVAVISLSLASVFPSYTVGLSAAAIAAIVLKYGSRLIPSSDGSEKSWTEPRWRRLLKISVYASLAAFLWVGFGMRKAPTNDEHRLVDLKTRLMTLPEVRRISLVASRDPIPVGLRYLLRCRWHDAEIITTEGWDTGLTEAMESEGDTPHSRFLVLEWARRDFRVSANPGQAWGVSAVGNPMQFYGRRLTLVLISPRA